MSEDATLDEFIESEPESDESSKDQLARKTVCGIPPTDWSVARLGEVVNIVSGNSLPNEYQDDSVGEHPVYKVSDMNEAGNEKYVTTSANWLDKDELEELNHTLYPTQTTILPKVGAALLTNKRRLLTEPSSFDNNVMGWVPDETNPEFMYYVSCMIDMEAVAQKGAVPSISKAIAKSIKLPSPSLSEQRKIATVLYTVDRVIQKTEEIIEQSNRIKKGLIQRFYSQGYFDHQEWQQVDMQDAYVMTRTNKLPAGWKIKKSRDIAEVKTGHTPSTSVDEYWNGDISWVDIHDLTQLEGTVIHSTDDTITEEGLNNSGAKLLPQGTLVLCRTGAIGETAILGKEMATDQDQVTFECDKSEVLPQYLMYLFEYATPQLERLSAGSTHDKVQLHFFSDLEIPLPEIDEQRQIVDVLKSVDEVSQANKEQLDNLHRVKRGLMQDLLSGTVRTTDTNIEVPEEIAQHG